MRNIEYGIACARPAPTSPIIPMLFDKYLDFIDVYAGVQAEEREALYRDLAEKAGLDVQEIEKMILH